MRGWYAGRVIRLAALLTLAALVAGCASSLGARDDRQAPVGVADTKPLEFRQPAIFVEVSASAADLEARDRSTLGSDYEGALLEALNARAVAVRDVELLADRGRRVDGRAAVARAREIGADAAILIKARVARETVTLCEETRRALRGQALVFHQDVEVLRASDGATRLRILDSPSLTAHEVEVDCDNPRGAVRRGVREAMNAAVAKLAKRLFGA